MVWKMLKTDSFYGFYFFITFLAVIGIVPIQNFSLDHRFQALIDIFLLFDL